MNKYKNMILGISVFLALSAVIFFGISPEASAFNKQPDKFYYDSCVDLVGVNNRGGTNCTFLSNGNLPGTDLLFDNGKFGVAFIVDEALYQVPYDKDQYKQPPPPSGVSLLDKNAKPATVNGNALGGRFNYSGVSYVSKGYDIVYFVYNSTGDPDYILLLGLKTNGEPPLILTMVNKKVQEDPRGDNRGTVYAYEINKSATLSSSTGAPIIPKPAPGSGEGDSTCESSNNSGFEWIFCGVLSLIDKMVNGLTEAIEGLLTFKTNEYLDQDVRVAWNVIKTIATILLVIVMLIMIFSQAISIGPFDAYTIRKVLPKLVIAVIIMQISWDMLIFFIQMANASGEAVRDLMYAPFGGSSKMQLDDLVGQLGAGSATLTVTTIFTGIAIGTIFSGITIGGAVLLGLTAVLSLVVGLLVLVLRQILILLAVILVPIALVLWILPGTQRYWKLWSDTFIKLLLLFPLIMAMIAAGRIFASLAGDLPENATNADGLLAVFIIFVGVFGPLWFLPKAFSWGGQLFSMASSATLSATKGIRGYPGKYALDRSKENRQYKASERNRRIGRDPQAASRWDRALAGGYNFARSEGARTRNLAGAVGEGQKAAREAVGQELTLAGYQNWKHEDKLKANEAWLRGEEFAGINAEGNEELRLFAFKTLADLGDQDRIRKARQQGRLKGSVWLKGRMENISSLNSQASDMGIQPDLSTVAPEAMSNWKSHTFREWIRQTQNGVTMDNSDDGGGDIRLNADQRRVQVLNAQNQAQRLLNSPFIFDRLSADQQDYVRQTATRGGAQVSVPAQGTVQIPSGVTLENRVSSREDLIANMSPGAPKPQLVAQTLASQIVQANLTPGSISAADQRGLEAVVRMVKDRAAAPDSTPQMQAADTNLRQALNSSLEEYLAQAEQRHTAANSPNTSALLAAERARTDAVRTRLGL